MLAAEAAIVSTTLDVAVVIVNYNTRDFLRVCIESVLRARDLGEVVEIVVVDSGSSDGSAEMARRYLGDGVVSLPNRGYGAAANIGFGATSARYVLVLNADTSVPPGTIPRLVEVLQAHRQVAIVGPRLRYPNGQVQSARRRFPTRMTPLFESTVVEEWWPGNRWTRLYRMDDVPDDGAQLVDWIVGAALLVRREAIEQAGGFDETFRMYSEEVEWCWRLRSHGWRVMHVPDVEIRHHEGASTGQDIPARQYDFDTSRVRLMQCMYGDRHARLVRYGLLVGYLVQVLRDGSKFLAGHRRELRRERMALYMKLMQRGLRQPFEERA